MSGVGGHQYQTRVPSSHRVEGDLLRPVLVSKGAAALRKRPRAHAALETQLAAVSLLVQREELRIDGKGCVLDGGLDSALAGATCLVVRHLDAELTRPAQTTEQDGDHVLARSPMAADVPVLVALEPFYVKRVP